MRHGINISAAVFTLSVLFITTARADVWIPPWGESLYDSTYITIDMQDSGTVVEIEVRSAVLKLINDDYILEFERNADLGAPQGQPVVTVSDRLVRSGYTENDFHFEFLSQIQVEDTLTFAVRTTYYYPASQLRWLTYTWRHRRISDDPIWGGWGEEENEVPMPVFNNMGRWTQIVSNRDILAAQGSWSEDQDQFGNWREGRAMAFEQEENGWEMRYPAIRIEFQQDGQDEVIDDIYTYQITPETREAVPNLILRDEVSIQHSVYWDTTAHSWGYSMVSEITLEPGIAMNLAPMWLWFPNDQTEDVEVDLVGLRLWGAWGSDSESWVEDSVETRPGRINNQNGFYIRVPWLEVQERTPNRYWYWTDPRLRVIVNSRWTVDSCRFILITAPIEESWIRFSISREFEFYEWSSPLESVTQGYRPGSKFLTFSGLCREPGIARVAWRPAQSAPFEPVAPSEFTITSVSPNPFNSRTTLNYSLPQSGEVRLGLRDMTGRLLHSEMIAGEAGENSLSIDAANLPAGIYLVELGTPEKVLRAKVVLVR